MNHSLNDFNAKIIDVLDVTQNAIEVNPFFISLMEKYSENDIVFVSVMG